MQPLDQEVDALIEEGKRKFLETVRYTYGFRYDMLGTKLLLDSGDTPLFKTGAEARAAGIELRDSLTEETRSRVELVELQIVPDQPPVVLHVCYPDLGLWLPEGCYVSEDRRVIASSFGDLSKLAQLEI